MDPLTKPINEKEDQDISLVDPFLVEALQNPRHRLTILRMELDIQKFLQTSDQQQYEFHHLPTSYLRLAAHRVAQHHGLQTKVHDISIDGPGNRITAIKTTKTKCPSIRLSEIAVKQPENERHELVKIAIKSRPNSCSPNKITEIGCKRSHVRTVEERKEDYDKARARIFSNPGSPTSDEAIGADDARRLCFIRDETSEGFTPSKVAIFRNAEKDRSDPDYDRSYQRYVRSLPVANNQALGLVPFMNVQFPYVQYESGFGNHEASSSSVSYVNTPQVGSHFGGYNRICESPVCMQWPSSAAIYAHSCEQSRQAIFQQSPLCQQALSFDYSQNN